MKAKAKIDDAAKRRVRAARLLHGFGTPLWVIKRVRVLIERRFGVQYSDVHVWRLLG